MIAKITISLLASLIILLAPAASHAAVQYTMTNLGSLDRPASVSLGIGPTGQVVGAVHDGNWGNSRPFLYSGGVTQNLGTLGGSTGSFNGAYGIDQNGRVVGVSNLAGDVAYHAFLWTPGGTDGIPSNPQMKDLGTLGGTSSRANAINAVGTIVGSSYISGDGAGHAFRYSGGVMEDLGDWGLTNSVAHDINATGQIVGYTGTTDQTTILPILYSDGVVHTLPTLGGTFGEAEDINSRGDVLGQSTLSGNNWDYAHAFLYSNGTIHDLGTLGGHGSFPGDINDNGTIVGHSYMPDGSIHAFIYADGVMRDLNDLIEPGSGWTIRSTNGLNNNGWIAAVASNAWGRQRAFLLTPVPEPASLSLLALAGLALRRRSGRAMMRRRIG